MIIAEMAQNLVEAKGIFRLKWHELIEQGGYKAQVAPFTVEMRHKHAQLWDALIEALQTGRDDFYLELIEKEGRTQARAKTELQNLLAQLTQMMNLFWATLSESALAETEPKFFIEMTRQLNQIRTKVQKALLKGFTEETLAMEQEAATAKNMLRLNNYMQIDLQNLLSNIPAFHVKRYKPEQAIFQSYAEDKSWLYFILEGRVRIYEILPDGREVTFSFLNEKDVFVQSANLGSYFHNVYAEAMCGTVIAKINQAALEELLSQSPLLTYRIINSFSTQLYQSQRIIEGLLGRDVSIRLARLLLQLSNEFGASPSQPTNHACAALPKPEAVQINLALTHQQIADMIGSNRVTVTRKLLEFQKAGVIEAGKHAITVLDQEKLTEIAA